MAMISATVARMPDPALLATANGQKSWKAAKDFEGMALGALLAPIFDTVSTAKNPFGGGDGEQAWRPMLTQEIARHIAAHGGLGLAMPVFNQMIRMQEQRSTQEMRGETQQ